MRAALVLGPRRVVQSVWRHEGAKWSHTEHLRFSLIQGNPQQRMRALMRPADIYLINYENLVWLSTQLQHYYLRHNTLLPFDMLVLDESTRMKNFNTRRMEAIIPLLPYFKRRIGLTGTPASNGLEDLFGQFLTIDDGERLGTNYNWYLSRFFETCDYNGYRYQATEAGEAYIHRVVSDIVFKLRPEEGVKLPDLIVNDLEVDLQPKHRAQYEQLERELFTELDNGTTLEVDNAAAKTTKCLQFAAGSIITNTETREWQKVHDAKLDALEGIVEESSGQPILVAYNYRADAQRIMERFKYALNLTAMSGEMFNETLRNWVDGKVRMLIGHPASMGHGVDRLQHAGNILVWFGPNWSLELTQQFNARLHRQGQTGPVTCHRILTKNTLDEAVILALDVKHQTQEALRAAVDEYRRRKGLSRAA
jgi:SNF2 family DNA or RNA helicase